MSQFSFHYRKDILAEEDSNGECHLNYYMNGQPADFGDDGKKIKGIEFMPNVQVGGKGEVVDYLYFSGSGILYTVRARSGSFGCVMNSKLCLPPDLVQNERIIGLLGSPNRNRKDDWMTKSGKDLQHNGKTKWKTAFEYWYVKIRKNA